MRSILQYLYGKTKEQKQLRKEAAQEQKPTRYKMTDHKLRSDYKRRERIFPLRFFIVYGNNSDGNLHRLNEPKNRRFI